MNIELIVVGKTDSADIERLVEDYAKRVTHYCRFSITTLPDLRNTKSLSPKQQKKSEGEMILKQLTDSDYVVLLDERGAQYRSVEFAQWLQKRMNSGVKRLVFIVGGPFGFAEEVYLRANSKISLSAMTFSHQVIRVFFAEQIYRAFTILRNEPYHNE
ncbi:MAG: 23S rRNA (pseudouridine(1915)-N(3))-methyltransferase RlmH [Rikenellaceae bacterium]